MMRWLSLLSLSLMFLTVANANPGLQAENVRINEAPPTVQVHAGYLDIKNNLAQAVDLIEVKSPLYDHIEIHLTKMEKGVARMRQQETITIPAKSSFSLAPGQYHLMLFDNKQALRAGNQVPLELFFSNGEKLELNADVIRQDGTGAHEHHH